MEEIVDKMTLHYLPIGLYFTVAFKVPRRIGGRLEGGARQHASKAQGVVFRFKSRGSAGHQG